MNLQKQPRILLPEWTKAAEGEVCTWPGCGRQDKTIVAAHSNMQIHGKGSGKKSHDLFIAFLCHHCHYEYDFGNNLTQAEKEWHFMRAMSATWLRLHQIGLIEVGTPVWAVPF